MILYIYKHVTNDPVYLQSQNKWSCIAITTWQMILYIYNHMTNDPVSKIIWQMILYLKLFDKWSCI